MNRQRYRLYHSLVSFSALILAGCVSLPERLESADKTVHASAYQQLLTIAKIDIADAERAVASLTDQDELTRLATSAKNVWIRMYAVKRVADPTIVGKVASSDKERIVREKAKERQKTLRVEEVKRMKNPSELERIAKTDGDRNVRIAAISRITDPSVLTSLYRSEKDLSIRKVIIAQSGDSSLKSEYESMMRIREQAQSDTRWRARLDAVQQLLPGRDDDVLYPIATKDSEHKVRMAAIRKLENQKFLYDIASKQLIKLNDMICWTNDSKEWCEEHNEALQKITDRTLLINLLRSGSGDYLGSWELKDIVVHLNEHDLEELALKSDKLAEVCIPLIDNQSFLTSLSKNGKGRVRGYSISRLTDRSFLDELAKYDDNDDIRGIAKRRLATLALDTNEPEELRRIARGDFGHDAQLKILARPGISKDIYSMAFKGFLSREGAGWSTDYNQDAEIIRKCPYDDLVQWVASNIGAIVHHDRGYYDEQNAKKELVRRGLYSKEKLDDENLKHDAAKAFLLGIGGEL